MVFLRFRGENIDHGIQEVPRSAVGGCVVDGVALPQEREIEYSRSYDDMLIAYSTIPGNCLGLLMLVCLSSYV